MTRAWVGLLAAFFIAIVAARVAYSISSDTGDGPFNEAWAQSKVEFVTWNNEKWTAWIHDGNFELIPEDKSNWSRHANASIAFVDWKGDTWQAKIEDEMFLLAFQGNWEGEIKRADALRYRDWNGNNQLRTVADLRR